MKKKLTCILVGLCCCSQMINAQNNDINDLKRQLASAGEDVHKVDVLADLARLYMFFSPDSAEAFGVEGLQLAQKLNYKRGQAGCMLSLCISLTFLGNYTGALEYGLKATPILVSLPDTMLLVWNKIQIMTCYKQLQDYEQALIHGNEALKLSRLYNAALNQVSVAIGGIGSVYEKKNQPDSALYYEQKAFALDTAWCQLFQFIGEAYAKKGNIDNALDYYKRGLHNSVEEKNSVAFIDLCKNISKIFELTGLPDSSIVYANKAISLARFKTNPEGLLEISTLLAQIYERQGKPDSTIKYLKLANGFKDNLFSRKKTREAQTFAFNETLHQQDLIAQHQRDVSKIRTAVLLAVLLIFLLVAFFLWRNNQQKQKAKNKIEKAYAELKSAQAQLIQSEKMASLGELTAGIGHEIQNPLNFVNNFSDVNKELLAEMNEEIDKGNLNEVKAISKSIVENGEKIAYHGGRADAIVKGMLQHSRSNSGHREMTDINTLCDEYLRLAYHGLRAKDKSFNAATIKEFDAAIGKINIVPQEIGRVILNLINNAFYAVNEKQKLASSNPGLDGYEPSVTVSTKKINEKPGSYRVEISVKDNGIGMPQNIVDKIFQPFFTTKPTGQGTGLGLSLSYDIVKAHGGEIKVKTKEGEGSEFIIFLPA